MYKQRDGQTDPKLYIVTGTGDGGQQTGMETERNTVKHLIYSRTLLMMTCAKEEMFSSAFVCLFVYFSQNSVERCHMGHGDHKISVVISIT